MSRNEIPLQVISDELEQMAEYVTGDNPPLFGRPAKPAGQSRWRQMSTAVRRRLHHRGRPRGDPAHVAGVIPSH